MDGYLLIDKPVGISSFGVVARVRGLISRELVKKIKVGHTGTLDPAASGLMILVIGSYCKKAGEFSKLDKTYDAELTLGAVSATADREGELTTKSTRCPTEKEILDCLNKFIGEIDQTPPAFSAIKINGKRAYKLAREGQEVILQPRKTTIYEITDINYDYPKLNFTVRVSSGTYIRSLAVDIGESLATGAYLSSLCRIKIASFDIKSAIKLDEVEFAGIKSHLKT